MKKKGTEAKRKETKMAVLLHQLDISPCRFADLCGVSKNVIYNIMAGHSPTYRIAQKIAKATKNKITIEDLGWVKDDRTIS